MNIYEVDGASKVHYRAMGEYFRQVNEADDYQISITQTDLTVDMQLINPFPHVLFYLHYNRLSISLWICTFLV